MPVVPSFVSNRVSARGWIATLSTAIIAGSAGCETDLGACQMDAAMTVVYRKDTDGTPFYAGQAIVQDSCSGYCHAANATGELRNGAPHGLNFDVSPLTAQSAAADEGTLRAGIAKVRDEAADLYGQIEGGDMPPGKVGMRSVPAYKTASGADANLPSIADAAGKATVRNWLACGAPVVSAVMGAPLATSAATIDKSQVVAGMPVMSTSATFTDVFTNVIKGGGCTTCHQPGGPFMYLDLSTQATAYTALVGKDASTSPGNQCAGKGKLVVANDCQNSLLYQKLLPSPMCGSQMPLGQTPLSQSSIDLVCNWIKAGAKM